MKKNYLLLLLIFGLISCDYENQNKMIEKNIILNSENKSIKAQINLLLLINIILILFIALYVI